MQAVPVELQQYIDTQKNQDFLEKNYGIFLVQRKMRKTKVYITWLLNGGTVSDVFLRRI